MVGTAVEIEGEGGERKDWTRADWVEICSCRADICLSRFESKALREAMVVSCSEIGSGCLAVGGLNLIVYEREEPVLSANHVFPL